MCRILVLQLYGHYEEDIALALGWEYLYYLHGAVESYPYTVALCCSYSLEHELVVEADGNCFSCDICRYYVIDLAYAGLALYLDDSVSYLAAQGSLVLLVYDKGSAVKAVCKLLLADDSLCLVAGGYAQLVVVEGAFKKP